MRKYSLYKARKVNAPNPENYACKIEDALEKKPWYLIAETSPDFDADSNDLIYYGHNMTYERCIAEIERLRRL